MSIRTATAALAIAALAGCGPLQTAPEPSGWVAVPVDRVVQSFDQICLASAPDFVTAPDRIARQGLTEPGPNGSLFLPGGGMSAKIATLPKSRGIARERCSVVFNTDDASQTQKDAASALEAALAARALVPDAPAADARVGQRTARIWTLSIDGRPARLSLIASRGPRFPAVLLLDVTAGTGTA